MLGFIVKAWNMPELRKRLIYTLFIVVIFRVGSVIPVPFLDTVALKGVMGNLSEGGAILNYLDTMSGGAFAQATLFAMSLTPYINSSIIMQLMGVAIPALEALQREGEEGRKKLTAITRYFTIILGIMQGTAYYMYLRGSQYGGATIIKYTEGFEAFFVAVVIVSVFTAGTALIMWLGEQINTKGIGNGVSILLFAGIVSRMPTLVAKLMAYVSLAITATEKYGKYYILVPVFILIFMMMIWVIVFMNDAERRIPIQYAKRTAGRKLYAGQSSHIPLKVGLAGVMPVIFASSILSIPTLVTLFMQPTGIVRSILEAFSVDGCIYMIMYFLLIIMFAYFYVAITYNPIEMANNLRQSNGGIPGIRPGKPTADYIARILSKVTFLGALFLAFIALFPMIFGRVTSMKNLSLGGTSIIILVGVALETVKQLESQIMMKHYKGFLD